MGERRKEALWPRFDRRIKLQFHGASVSSDAGLFPFRDLDEVCGLTEASAAELFDFRTATNIRHGIVALLRQFGVRPPPPARSGVLRPMCSPRTATRRISGVAVVSIETGSCGQCARRLARLTMCDAFRAVRERIKPWSWTRISVLGDEKGLEHAACGGTLVIQVASTELAERQLANVRRIKSTRPHERQGGRLIGAC